PALCSTQVDVHGAPLDAIDHSICELALTASQLAQRPVALQVAQVTHHGGAGGLGGKPLEVVNWQVTLGHASVGLALPEHGVPPAGLGCGRAGGVAGGLEGPPVGGRQRLLDGAPEVLERHPDFCAELLQRGQRGLRRLRLAACLSHRYRDATRRPAMMSVHLRLVTSSFRPRIKTPASSTEASWPSSATSVSPER